jgi:hypothetical protein
MPQTVFVSLGPGGDLGWRLLVFVGVALVVGLAMIPRQCPASLSQPLRLGDMAIGSWARAPLTRSRQIAHKTVKAPQHKLLFEIPHWQKTK